MSSAVADLQKDALNNEVTLSSLLLKALFVARKLKITTFEAWMIKRELDGYDKSDSELLPVYRKSYCQVKMRNPYHGWQSIIFANQKQEEAFSTVLISQPISEIEKLKNVTTAKGEMTAPLSSESVLSLYQLIGHQLPVERFLSYTVIDKICASVRKVILEWALTLEEQGILGEGMCFTEDEKDKATINQNVYISSFQGVLGEVHNSTVTQSFEFSVRKHNLSDLERAFKQLNIEQHDIDTLTEALNAEVLGEDNKKIGPKVANWIGGMLSKAITGGWNITLEVATSLLEKYISSYYGFK